MDTKLKIVGIIPARMASSRFPGKPLAKIHGIPMVGHCYLRSKMSRTLDDLYVATCDQEIFEYVKSIGGKPIMTSDRHEMCNDRVAEAAAKLEAEWQSKIDIVVNIQGDLPMVFPEMIDEVVRPLVEDRNILCATMMDEVTSLEDFDDPNRVKVIVDKQNYAIYLTREPIPSRRKYKGSFPKYKHVALRAFRRDLLLELSRMEMTPLETIEGIDDLRLIENGYKIKVVLTKYKTETVDTVEDLRKVEKMMVGDPLMPGYAQE